MKPNAVELPPEVLYFCQMNAMRAAIESYLLLVGECFGQECAVELSLEDDFDDSRKRIVATIKMPWQWSVDKGLAAYRALIEKWVRSETYESRKQIVTSYFFETLPEAEWGISYVI